MPTIYILLTRTGTVFSRLIGLATGDRYTHAALALDKELQSVYSFSRLHPQFMLPAGLVREDVRAGIYKKFLECPSKLYALEISESAYARLRDRLADMLGHRKKYRYSVLGVVLCFFNIPLKRKRKFFCSQFVGELLETSGEARLLKPPALLRPNDFCGLEELRLVYSGKLAGVAA